jgi:hypothetical protein
MSSYVIGVYRARRPDDHVATHVRRSLSEQHRKDDRAVAAPERARIELGPEEHKTRAPKNRRPSRTTERRKAMTNRAILPAVDRVDRVDRVGRADRADRADRATARPGACSEIRRQLMAGRARLLATETGSHAQRCATGNSRCPIRRREPAPRYTGEPATPGVSKPWLEVRP